jgi:DNA-binding Lrp family transcriptional regulator
MARKAFVADDAKRERVRYLAGLGVPQKDIARLIGCSPKTLRKRFRDELDRGVAEANAVISGSLFAAAKAGNTTAQIFWLKTRAHWHERGPDGAVQDAAEPLQSAVLVLPDNNRDPELTEVLRDAQAQYFARKQRQAIPDRGGVSHD